MPIEDIEVRKAPRGWQPTSDQRQQIERDPRLQRLSQDELYYFFNQPKRPGTPTRAKQGATPAPSSSGIFGWIDSVTRALRGN